MVAYSYIYYQTNLFSKNKNVGFVSPKFPINKSSNKILMFRAMGISETMSFGICCSFTLDTHLDQGEWVYEEHTFRKGRAINVWLC